MSFDLSNAVNPAKVFMTNSSGLEPRWDPNYYKGMSAFQERVKDCAFPIEKLKSSLALAQYGISERATDDPIGVPMLRMINLQDDTWDLSDLKFIDMAEGDKKRYLVEAGDILFNRTNSKELVGKCGVFNATGEYVFASYLIRVRLKEGALLPDYVTAFLSSSVGRLQIDAVSRQIAGMTNINAEEIRGLLIPVADRATQEKVVKAWRTAILNRDQTLTKASHILSTVDDVLLRELGVSRQTEAVNSIEQRIFLASSAKLTGCRWDPLFHKANVFHFIGGAACGLVRLGELANYMISGFAAGRDDQANQEAGIVQIRPTNLSDDRELVFHRNVYIAASEINARRRDVLLRREVLFNNTNSQELVGKTVWFDLDGPYFSSNHITRIAADPGRLDAQYLSHVLNLYQRRKVFFKLCTNWNNQSGVGTDILQRVPIPLPSLARQVEIVGQLENIRCQARTLRLRARTELESSKREIEALILGRNSK
ncbi:MAG: restriction endonuclease subunit S [Proteobacteria bacterium]|nr:MAG: restriction endonuclease subunit S [Pseudomonadota bacterium]